MNNVSKLSYEDIENIALELKNASESMNDVLNNVKTLFGNVGDDSVWSGTAASETKTSFDILSAKFPEFSGAVADCCTYLNTVVANYKAVDKIITGEQK